MGRNLILENGLEMGDGQASGQCAADCSPHRPQFHWEGVTRAQWDAFHAAHAAPLQQDWAYGDALSALGARPLRCLVSHGGETVAIAQFGVRSLLGPLAVALCTRGPVWSASVGSARRQRFMRQMLRTMPVQWSCVKLVSPAEVDPREGGAGNLHRVMTGYSTVLIDLQPPLDVLRAGLQRKWRNRLAAAERSGLRVERIGGKPVQYRWLLEREAAQRLRRGYTGLPGAFVTAYQEARDADGTTADSLLGLRVVRGRDPVAGILFLRHGSAATYHLGWSDPAHPVPGAGQLLLWTGMTMLKAAGLRRLDLGGINTDRSADVARFKLGTGGAVVTLAGTFW